MSRLVALYSCRFEYIIGVGELEQPAGGGEAGGDGADKRDEGRRRGSSAARFVGLEEVRSEAHQGLALSEVS